MVRLAVEGGSRDRSNGVFGDDADEFQWVDELGVAMQAWRRSWRRDFGNWLGDTSC